MKVSTSQALTVLMVGIKVFSQQMDIPLTTKSLLVITEVWTMVIVRHMHAGAYGLYSSKFASGFEYLYKYHNFL
jgi:hypothetical protein